MKHLEEAREVDLEEQANSQNATVATDGSPDDGDTRPSKSSLRVPTEKQRKVSFGDERSLYSENDRLESEANNNAELREKTGSESSLCSQEMDRLIRPRRDSDMLRKLPPIDRSDNISLRSTGSAGSCLFKDRAKTFPKQAESASVPELSGPKPHGMDRGERKLSPRAPIYHLSEDSDWYDSVLNVGNSSAKLGNYVTSTDALITSEMDTDGSGRSASSKNHAPAPRTPQNAPITLKILRLDNVHSVRLMKISASESKPFPSRKFRLSQAKKTAAAFRIQTAVLNRSRRRT